MLEVRDLVCGYAGVSAIKGVSLAVARGRARRAHRRQRRRQDDAAAGDLVPAACRREDSIVFDGTDITRASPQRVLPLGLAHCPEGRRVFANLTVLENLEMGCYLRTDQHGDRRGP